MQRIIELEQQLAASEAARVVLEKELQEIFAFGSIHTGMGFTCAQMAKKSLDTTIPRGAEGGK